VPVLEQSSPRTATRPHPGERRVRLSGRFAQLVGLMTILSSVTPPLRSRLQQFDRILTPAQETIAGGAALLLGACLILLGSALVRRSRRAWSLATGVLLLSAGAHLFKGLDLEEALVCLALVAWLLWNRRLFNAPSDPYSIRRALP
jgi:lysyl-tRNA synthetase, class II